MAGDLERASQTGQCWHALVAFEFAPDAPGVFRRWAGAYVNAWVVAASPEAARHVIEEALIQERHAAAVQFESIEVGDPRELEVEDEADPELTRPATDAELKARLTDGTPVFTAFLVWRRRRWWQRLCDRFLGKADEDSAQ